MHFFKPEIEMFINRNREMKKKTAKSERVRAKTLSQLALVLCFKITIFFIVAPRLKWFEIFLLFAGKEQKRKQP